MIFAMCFCRPSKNAFTITFFIFPKKKKEIKTKIITNKAKVNVVAFYFNIIANDWELLNYSVLLLD